MLRKDNFVFISVLILIFNSCGLDRKDSDNLTQNDNNIKENAIIALTEKGYNDLYSSASDTLRNWVDNFLLFSPNDVATDYKIDSTFCINSTKNKFIGIRHSQCNIKPTCNDGVEEFFGAKIDGKWYFWSGGYMPVPRGLFKGHDPKKPLSYAQLHSQALDFMSGYLDANGNIRDQWFEAKFKGSGWGYFKDRYKYKSTLDGHQVDSEQGYYNYLWKKGGMMNWISKFSNDSIRKQEDFLGHRLSTEEKNEIRMFITRKLMNSQFPMYRGKYKG